MGLPVEHGCQYHHALLVGNLDPAGVGFVSNGPASNGTDGQIKGYIKSYSCI